MGKYIYVLKYHRQFSNPISFSLNCWGKSNWPRPNGGVTRVFKTKFDADWFLAQQEKKGRKVFGLWNPYRIRVRNKTFEGLDWS